MMYYGYGMGTGWILMGVVVVVPIFLLALGFALMQSQRDVARPPIPDRTLGAERVLDDRLARGEIDIEEYMQRMQTLHAEHR